MERLCHNCNTRLFGRVDQKFCSDQCRTDFNNRLNGEANNLIRRINRILQKNRRIMKMLNPNGRSRIHKSKMIDMGFNFKYYTHRSKVKSGNEYYFCYDQGYLSCDEEYYSIIEKQKG